ncbi:MAG: ABC transporter ATP-binding protein [Myxococcales bacterium]|nr:ABC transporter ATP-binding protein [Myxococcales bacterium]
MSAPALQVQDLVKTFDVGFLGAVPGVRRLTRGWNLKGIAQRVEAVRGLSLTVAPGQTFGFLGPNGAGKTTTIKMLMGLIHPTSGGGTLLGEPLGSKAARARLGFLPEHPYFYEYLKPLEFLDFYGSLFNMTARERKRRAEALIDRVGLQHAINRPIRKFSKGMVQRIGVAQALINDPDLVVLDEPMSGLDPMGRKDVRDIITDLRAKGKTVFFSSHILQDVELICDRVAIVTHGRVRAEGPLDELMDAPTANVEVVARGLDGAAVARLAERALTAQPAGAGRQSFMLADESAVAPFLAALAAEAGNLISVVPHRRSLEEIFVETAGREEAP